MWKLKPIFKVFLNNQYQTNHSIFYNVTGPAEHLNTQRWSINHKCMCNSTLLANQVRVVDTSENMSHWAREETIRREKSHLLKLLLRSLNARRQTRSPWVVRIVIYKSLLCTDLLKVRILYYKRFIKPLISKSVAWIYFPHLHPESWWSCLK